MLNFGASKPRVKGGGPGPPGPPPGSAPGFICRSYPNFVTLSRNAQNADVNTRTIEISQCAIIDKGISSNQYAN